MKVVRCVSQAWPPTKGGQRSDRHGVLARAFLRLFAPLAPLRLCAFY
jgi:hypothetical protein